ncbi:MAG: hypothetical protein RLZZ165_205 [Bacteroidota bacterium]
MTQYTLPYFGALPTDHLESYYEIRAELGGKEIRIDLNFENQTIETATMDKVKLLIEGIERLDAQNKIYILKDYKDENGDTVKTYLEHHLEEVDPEELSELIDLEDPTTSPEEQLLTKLHLVRVGLYPDGAHGSENFAVFDYSIGKEITDYLVVINTDENGEPEEITMES